MNYRHAFHAGGFCDVFKHALFSWVLDYLRRKENPFCVLDTHAGIGRYDLSSIESQKTQEAHDGILKLLKHNDAPPSLKPYLEAVYRVNQNQRQEISFYPGSPCIAQMALRPQDKLILSELHPDDARTLKKHFADDPRVTVHYMDGYTALKAHLPPKEKRGVVLIDPAFEVKDEFTAMVNGLVTGYDRWPQGIYMVWYPIKERPALWNFEEALVAWGTRRILKAEMLIYPEDTHLRLNGCGLMVINPPWGFDSMLEQTLPWLCSTLGSSHSKSHVSWLIPE